MPPPSTAAPRPASAPHRQRCDRGNNGRDQRGMGDLRPAGESDRPSASPWERPRYPRRGPMRRSEQCSPAPSQHCTCEPALSPRLAAQLTKPDPRAVRDPPALPCNFDEGRAWERCVFSRGGTLGKGLYLLVSLQCSIEFQGFGCNARKKGSLIASPTSPRREASLLDLARNLSSGPFFFPRRRRRCSPPSP